MISTRTNIEIVHTIEKWTNADKDRLMGFFDIIIPQSQNLSGPQKTNLLIEPLKDINRKGPYTDSFQLDIITYIIEKHYRENASSKSIDFLTDSPEPNTDSFSKKHPELLNCLNRDGYTIREKKIVKLLPEEIVEAKTESELIRLLQKFEFTIAKGHLEQAIEAHTIGNWSSANTWESSSDGISWVNPSTLAPTSSAFNIEILNKLKEKGIFSTVSEKNNKITVIKNPDLKW